MKRRSVLMTAAGFALGTAVRAGNRDERWDAAADVLERATKSKQVDAAAFYASCGDRSFAKSFGAAETVDAVFLLASITKPMAVAAVMTLFDAGEFRLSDRVIRFVPEFSGDRREQVTMQQLLTHTSGLPDQLANNQKLRAAHSPLQTFVSGAIRTPLRFQPGTRYGYSSMGILLASEVARRITGKPIAMLVNDTVFQPLSMNRSALGVGQLDVTKLVRCQTLQAASESGAGDPSTRSWDWNSDYWRRLGVPWGGAHASVGDVANFLQTFLRHDGRILREETTQKMVRNHNPPEVHPRGLGFALAADLACAGRSTSVFGHTGATGTLCWVDPATDSMCIVLTTLPARAADPHPRDVASQIVAGAKKR